MIGGFSLYVGLKPWPPGLVVEFSRPDETDDEDEGGESVRVEDTARIDVEECDVLWANRRMGFAPARTPER